MNRTEDFLELRSLLEQATAELGEHRVALAAGCSLSALRAWMTRPACTADQTLPRLRLWRTWVPGYMDELTEMGRVAGTEIHSLIPELHTRLMQALATLTLNQVALGCEVPLSRLAAWIAGQYAQADLALMVKALAHLRHVSSWPAVPRARTDSCALDDQHLAEGRGQGA